METVKKTSDLPWAASAVAMTIVGTYIALQPHDPVSDHGHDDEHGEKHEDNEEDTVEKSEDESEEKSEDKEEKPKDEGKSGDDDGGDEGEEKKDDSNDDSKDDSKSVDAGEDIKKGATKNKVDIKKSEGDQGKGANKKRIDSPAGKTIGEGSSSGEYEDDEAQKAQAGFSNTDTKHSTDPAKDPTKSSKGEGTAETAKIKGTVDPDRKQV